MDIIRKNESYLSLKTLNYKKKLSMRNKLCIMSITASHYRKRIYELLDSAFDCRFIFGVDNTSVKRLDTSILKDSINNQNIYIYGTPFYYQKNILSQTSNWQVIINDLGIFCLSGWLLMILAKFRKQRVFLWDHGWYGREGFVKKWIKRAYFGLADGSFIYGEYAKKLMEKNGFSKDKLHVIHNSLDYDTQLSIRKTIAKTSLYKDYFKNENPVICFIGRLTPVKKLNLLVSALHILAENGKSFNLVIIGDGEERKNIETLVSSLQLKENVWLYGPCYDENTNASLIYNADVCVSPGNVGLTAMHAMMFGCPVITHNDLPWQMPEFEAIKQGKTGDFFNHGDVMSLADCIARWFQTYGESREEIRHQCFKEIDEEWNPHRQLEIIKSVIYE